MRGAMGEPAPAGASLASSRDPYAGLPFGWYGEVPAFQVRLERDLARIKGISGPVTRHLDEHQLRYEVPGLEVPGDLEIHNITIVFWPDHSLARRFGIPACDYPIVSTDVRRTRKHENSDGTLCLWAAFDPPERRWNHLQGLGTLVEVIRTHLFLEHHWLMTGGPGRGEWIIPDAPHGPPQARSHAA